MKNLAILITILVYNISLFAQETTTTAIAPATEEGNNLELAAVLDLFKDSKDLEDFERKLNDKEIGVNNLDLNNDSIIDYIRVVEQGEEGSNTRVVILQAVLGDNQFQDVATINIEKSGDDVKVQCQGDEEIYGQDYYVEPEPKVHVNINVWPIWGVMFAPRYVYYRSPYYWHHYPHYWHPYRPVPYTTYAGRTVIVGSRGIYVHTRRAVVHRPPVYHRTYSSRAVVHKRNNYSRNSSGSYNSGRTSNSRQNQQGTRPANERKPTSTRPNSGRQSAQPNRGSQQARPSQSSRQAQPSRQTQSGRTAPQQRHNGNVQRKPSSGQRVQPRTGGASRSRSAAPARRTTRRR